MEACLCIRYRHTGTAPEVTRTQLIRVVFNLNNHRYISQILRSVAVPYLLGLGDVIFQEDNTRQGRRYRHISRISMGPSSHKGPTCVIF
ncbi:hypothetical protein TNCV_707731 [Trichonephila clavipes]|nr:hypothetical protein TNCV_707731 [Trichonephila clavipes]